MNQDISIRQVPNTSQSENQYRVFQSIQRKYQKKTELQRFEAARKYLLNAIYNKSSHFGYNMHNQESTAFHKFVNFSQNSLFLYNILALFSYFFMYLIFISHKKPKQNQFIAQIVLLSLFWINLLLQLCYKMGLSIRQYSGLTMYLFFKIGLLMILSIDQVISVTQQNTKHFVRPFLVFRCLLPVFHHNSLRKNFVSLLSIYKDVLAFAIFYCFIVLIFTLFFNAQIDMSKIEDYDEYSENFAIFGRAIFIIYSLASFQAFPDRQVKVFKTQPTFIIFFVALILLNVFFFVQIPTTLVFKAFQRQRSKYIFADRIKQKASLIWAFCCICDKKMKITGEVFMKFLLYAFRNKPGYIQIITQIYMELDENRNNSVQATEFVRLCEIMYSYGSVYPPMFDDWGVWINFRRFLKQTFNLKQIVLTWQFKIFSCVLVLLSIINAILFIILSWRILGVIDNLLIIVFIIEILLKFLGLGPENLFKDPWNKIDFFLLIIYLFLLATPLNSQIHKLGVLLKFARFYRVALLIQYLADKNSLVQLSRVSIKVSRLITQTLMTISIVIEFIPLLLIFFYYVGVVGIEIYGNTAPIHKVIESPHSKYDQVLNFNKFLYSQFYTVQLLVQSGWSFVCLDYAFRYDVAYAATVFFFISSHFLIAIVVKSLIKGVTWEIYQTIHKAYDERTRRIIRKKQQQDEIKQKKICLFKVKDQIKQNQVLILQNIISRQIIQTRIDKQISCKIFDSFKKYLNADEESIKIITEDKQFEEKPSLTKIPSEISIQSTNQTQERKILRDVRIQQINDEDILNSDIQLQMEKLIGYAKLDESCCFFTHKIIYDKHLNSFLKQKFSKKSFKNQENYLQGQQQEACIQNIHAEQKIQLINQFDSQQHFLYQKRYGFHLLFRSLGSILQMNFSKKRKKMKLISEIVQQGIITALEAQNLHPMINTELERTDSNFVLRKLFLANLNPKFIDNLQMQHFVNIYGKEFQQMNRVSLRPLLNSASKLTSCLSSALRYTQIDTFSFFKIILKIQQQIATALLQPGSLFKFVFQMEKYNQNWFSIQIQNNEVTPTFIKNGIWIWDRQFADDQIKIAKDLFYAQTLFDKKDKKIPLNQDNLILQKNIKFLYQSFQALALCNNKNKKYFFMGNPKQQKYDLYCFCRNLREITKIKKNYFPIQRIMVILLRNQGKRIINGQIKQLNYQLTDIQRNSETYMQFSQISQVQKMQNNKKQLLQKMTNPQLIKQQQDSHRYLPFAFIVNLLQDIKDIIKMNQNNFCYQVQKAVQRSIVLAAKQYKFTS